MMLRFNLNSNLNLNSKFEFKTSRLNIRDALQRVQHVHIVYIRLPPLSLTDFRESARIAIVTSLSLGRSRVRPRDSSGFHSALWHGSFCVILLPGDSPGLASLGDSAACQYVAHFGKGGVVSVARHHFWQTCSSRLRRSRYTFGGGVVREVWLRMWWHMGVETGAAHDFVVAEMRVALNQLRLEALGVNGGTRVSRSKQRMISW